MPKISQSFYRIGPRGASKFRPWPARPLERAGRRAKAGSLGDAATRGIASAGLFPQAGRVRCVVYLAELLDRDVRVDQMCCSTFDLRPSPTASHPEHSGTDLDLAARELGNEYRSLP